jgi:hypothetical protein
MAKSLKKGQTHRFNLTVYQEDGTTPFNMTGMSGRMVIEGNGVLLEKTITFNAPLSGGTGYADIVQSDYSVLTEGEYAVEFWIYSGNGDAYMDAPVYSDTITVVDIPQRTRA